METKTEKINSNHPQQFFLEKKYYLPNGEFNRLYGYQSTIAVSG